MQINTQSKAFTLVELIVVITILAILGTIAFISLQGYSKSARDGTRITDINSIKKTLELFIVEKGLYPMPDNGTQITYSGGLVWTQGTVGDNMITNLGRINKKPLDPLTNTEYTYSVININTEYQLGAIYEGGSIIGNNEDNKDLYTSIISKTNADTEKEATAMIMGTYNEKILKVDTLTTTYVLALPSIIDADLTDTNLKSIIIDKKLVYNNYSNLSDSYKNLGYTMTGGFEFNPPSNNIEIYSGSLTDLSNSGAVQQQFITKLKAIYNGTIIQSETAIKEIIEATTPEQQQTLVGNYITNHVGGLTGINTVATQTQTQAQTYSCTGTILTANTTITNTTNLTANTPYQTTNSANSCYYTCNANYSGTNCEIYTAPVTGWRLLDPNCKRDDVVILTQTGGTQTWAGCNSTLGNGFEWGKKDDGMDGTINSCYNYDGSSYPANCPIGANSMASNTSAIGFFNTMQPDLINKYNDSEVDNIWGKLYLWTNASSACPSGRHLPYNEEWNLLQDTLAGTTCRTTLGAQCDGLGWYHHNTNINNMVQVLGIPLSGFRAYTEFFRRGNETALWSSIPNNSTSYYLYFNLDSSTIYQYYDIHQSYGYFSYSVRCIKD